jgi:DNA-binding GntR family transcriptional regulator
MAQLATHNEQASQLLTDHARSRVPRNDDDQRLFDAWADFHELLGALCGNDVMSLSAAAL